MLQKPPQPQCPSPSQGHPNGGSTTTISGGTLTAGVWHHVVATLNNKTASVYLDGKIQSLLTMSHYVAYGTEDFVLCSTRGAKVVPIPADACSALGTRYCRALLGAPPLAASLCASS